MSEDKKKLAANREKRKERTEAVLQILEDFRSRLYFNQSDGLFLLRDGDVIKTFRAIDRKIRATVRAAGGKITKPKLADFLDVIIDTRAVTRASPFAGRRTGEIIMASGEKWLVTSEARLIEPKRGSLKQIRKFLKKLLGEPGFVVLCAWLQVQLRAVRSGEHTPAPMMILTGDTGDGKSFALWIIGQLLGGRVTNPLRSWLGNLPWNDPILRSEGLQIDDSNTNEDYKNRKALAGAFKETIYADSVSIDKRHTDGFSVRPVNCVVAACNFNGTAIRVLPPPEEPDLKDKLIIIRTQESKPLFHEEGDEAREKRRQAYEEEFAAFAYYLEKVFKAPNNLPSGVRRVRGGLLWQDPDALAQLYELSPVSKVEAALEEHLADVEEDIEGLSTSGIRSLITNDGGRRDNRLHEEDGVLGRYFSQLAKRPESCISTTKKNGNACEWTLHGRACPPPN